MCVCVCGGGGYSSPSFKDHPRDMSNSGHIKQVVCQWRSNNKTKIAIGT